MTGGMTGDVCDCGICTVEVCDLCAAPVAFGRGGRHDAHESRL